MAQHMRNVLLGMGVIVGSEGVNHPKEFENRFVLNRFHSHLLSQLACLKVDVVLDRL